MKKDTYIDMINWIKNRPALMRFIICANRIFTIFVYVSFFVMLFCLLVRKNFTDVIRLVAGTSIPFILVSAFRSLIDRERPYQRFETAPVIPKEKRGSSYPSRHVFSVFIIAIAAFCFYGYPAWIIIVSGIIIAALRVVGGVHYITDVICGALFGILFGYISFFVV